MSEFPHQMSGGMRQRAVGAIALSGGPELIIADEPTTNLDVTIQAQYLNMLKDLQRRTGVALLFITHNLGIVAKMCDRVAVMYAGRIVEQGPVPRDLQQPAPPLHRRRCSARSRRSAAKSRSTPSPASRRTWPRCRPGCSFHPRCPQRLDRCRSERAASTRPRRSSTERAAGWREAHGHGGPRRRSSCRRTAPTLRPTAG